MNHFVYILKSQKDNGWYIGYTKNINMRVKEHNYGKVKSTKNRRPLELIYKEHFDSAKNAKSAEKYYKSGAGRAKLKKMIKY